jgi:hypothetical protein
MRPTPKASACAVGLLAILGLAAGCERLLSLASGGVAGSGVIKTETRDVGTFVSVDVQGAYLVEIACQQSESGVVVEADDNLLPLIHTDITDGKLTISSDKHFSATKTVRVRIATGTLRGLGSSGANEITVRGVNADQFGIRDAGASKIEIHGQAKAVSIESSGAGSVNAEDLHAARVTVNSSGAGSARVYATDELNVDASGAASVTYFGDPPTVHKSLSGASSVGKG